MILHVCDKCNREQKKNINISFGSVKQLNDFVHQELIINN